VVLSAARGRVRRHFDRRKIAGQEKEKVGGENTDQRSSKRVVSAWWVTRRLLGRLQGKKDLPKRCKQRKGQKKKAFPKLSSYSLPVGTAPHGQKGEPQEGKGSGKKGKKKERDEGGGESVQVAVRRRTTVGREEGKSRMGEEGRGDGV